MKQAGKRFEELLKIMDLLLGPGGCPWDKKQTFRSLRQYVIEEAYEVVDAIEKKDKKRIAEELGDLLLLVLFLSKLGEESKEFNIIDVIEKISEKMIRRHPHVFGKEVAKTPEDVLKRWGRIKRDEGRRFLFDGIPKNLPALIQAYRISEKASHAGFDWEKSEDVMKKVEEEFAELKEALKRKKGIDQELGDLLFALANLARWLKRNPEFSLRRANKRFMNRFTYMEKEITRMKKEIHQMSPEELDKLWERAKQRFP